MFLIAAHSVLKPRREALQHLTNSLIFGLKGLTDQIELPSQHAAA
jgi:hypothetical protein